MSNFRRFKEYLSAKGKFQEKPVDWDNGDTGPTPEKYPESPAKSGKNWKVTTPQDRAKPYVGVGTDPGQAKYDKGFGNDGDRKNLYEPKVGKPEKEGGKKLDSWPKGKTEAFLDNTKELTLAEFASYVSEQNKNGLNNLPTITAYKAGPFCPDPMQAMRYVTTLVAANDRLMESLVIMLKSKGGLDKFLREASNHTDTYNELAFLLADPENGSTVAHRLVKSLSEITMEEIDIPADKDTKVVNVKKKPKPMQPDPNGQPGIQQPDPNAQQQPQNTQQPATGPDGQPIPGAGIQATPQGGGPQQMQQPEHHLITALKAKRMI